MNTDKHRFALTIVLLSLVLIAAQQQAEADVFSRVPEAIRAKLIERVKLVVEYQSGHKWNELHSLISDLYLQGKTKEAFVKEGHPFPGLISFTPYFVNGSDATNADGSRKFRLWYIEGCAVERHRGKLEKSAAQLWAYYEGGRWTFSVISGVLASVDGASKPCPQQESKQTGH